MLLAAAVPALFIELTPGSFSSLASAQPSTVGVRLLRDGVGAGAVAPTHVVVDTALPGGPTTPTCALRSTGSATGSCSTPRR